MSDLRPDDIRNTHDSQRDAEQIAERAELPPHLLPIHDRLIGDGARWRWRAPKGAGLADWARATLAATRADAPQRSASAPRLRERRLGTLDSEHSTPHPSYGPKGPMRDMNMSRIRSYVGAAAAVLVVGLIALLLTHGLGNRGTGASADATPTVTATPAATDTPGSQQAQYTQPDQLPVISISDPSIAYKLASGALQRSSDGGKTYSSLALPKTDLSQVDSMSLAVSPLDASHIFVMLSGKKSDQGCSPPNSPYPAIAMHGGVLASGYVPCAEQYMSVDGGHTWTQPKLPTGGVIGGLNMMRSVQGAYGDMSYVIQAQGQRLYAAMAFDNLGGSLVDSPGVRLIASDDGGVTWRFADSGLATSKRYICDFAASPIPSTVYAVTGDNACGGMTYPNLSLYRSENGGQSWSRMSSLPAQGETGLFVGAHGELYAYMPVVSVKGQGASVTGSPRNVMVSVDGGATFIGSIPSGLPLVGNISGPYATLADGSIVIGEYGATPGPGPQTLYSWKKGQNGWASLKVNISAGIAAVMAQPVASGATSQTLTIIANNGDVSTVTVPLS